MKCSDCHNDRCKRNHQNRNRCLRKGECSCTCQESEYETAIKAIASIASGIIAAAGGVIFVKSGSSFSNVAGSAIIAAGSLMILNPIRKKRVGERMTLKDSVLEFLATGTVIALSAYVGTFVKGSSDIEQFAKRVGSGAVAGAISGAANAGLKYVKGEDVSTKSCAMDIYKGVIVGSVGGASSHFIRKIPTEVMGGQISKPYAQLGAAATTVAVTDAGIQRYNDSEDRYQFNPERILFLLASGFVFLFLSKVCFLWCRQYSVSFLVKCEMCK